MATKSGVGKIILVSNRLPVTIVEEGGTLTASRSVGGLATALTAVFERSGTVWVGWSGFPRRLKRAELAHLPLPPSMIPVNLSRRQTRSYYDRIANGILWPVFHHFPLPRHVYTEADWQIMLSAVKQFAQTIVRVAKPKDIIWIHDFHLTALPGMLRQAGLKNRIGFFLHIPFPERQYIAGLPHHVDMMASLAQADVLGFQTDRDVQRFRQAAQSLLPTPLRSQTQNFPIGIDYAAYNKAIGQPAVRAKVEELRQQLDGKRLILSISRLDYTKGIVAQLQAVEHLLGTLSPPERQNIVYKLIVAPSREKITAYRKLKSRIDSTVARINKRFATASGQPIQYEYQSHGFEGVVAHCQAADVFLVVPVVDGMNLLAKEYVASHGDDPGVLVLSKTAGAAAQLQSALLVDPHDIQQITDALRQGLYMPPAERQQRWHSLQTAVRDQDVYWWAREFLNTLTNI